MTTLVPRPPYTNEELRQLYPKRLELQLVQIFLRHGERTPVSTRFQNTGLHPYWPYCNIASRLAAMASSRQDLSTWDTFQWKRRMERFGDADEPVIALGPKGEVDGICQLGELTDKGRQTTFELGQRLRYLYVERLGFMPEIISNTDNIYLRSTPIPRALESLQSAFWGMYPPSARTADFVRPSIVVRSAAEETLFPNEGGCHRFRQLARLFAQRAADKWNDSEEMAYLNSTWSKWMPADSPRVAVDSRPRLSGIMDTVASTYAHGPNTRLPAEFYDPKARNIADKIAVDEWFTGAQESREYRKLAIGALMGDVVERMVHTAAYNGWRPMAAASPSGGESPAVKLAMSGCHDTTLASMLASIGAFKDEKWPPYTSSIAVELFKDVSEPAGGMSGSPAGLVLEEFSGPSTQKPASDKPSFLSFLNGKKKQPASQPASLARSSQASQPSLSKHYVRIRYNDKPVTIPGCAANPANHLPGDKSFCTLEAFKEIVDKFTPADWRQECGMNLDKGMFPEGEQQPAGY
ncbi:putative acid phosphatase [Microsporum canis]